MAQLLAERGPVYAQDLCRAALVATRVFEHCREQRWFDFAEDQVVKCGRLVAVEVLEVLP